MKMRMKKTRKLNTLLLTLSITAILISACASQTGQVATEAKTQNLTQSIVASATPTAGEEQRGLVYSIDYDFVSLNFFKRMYKGEHLLAHLITDTLGTVRSDGTIEYLLAESYVLSDDGLTYTFHIRDNVYFHNGVKLTADDVVWSFEECQKLENQAATFLNVKSFNKIDDLTVQVTMSAPYGFALSNLMNEVSILPKAYFQEVGESGYEEHPIGTGPYIFVNRVEGVSVTVKRNENYWRGPASFSTITLKVIPDATTGAMALENGEVDILLVNASDVKTLKANPNITVASMPSNYLAYVILNQNKAPFDNQLVRQAVAYALDRDSMVNAILEGYGEANSVLCPRCVFGYSDNIKPTYEYNLEKAKELITQSGLKTPIDIGDIVCWSTTSSIAEMVQFNLSQIGLNAKIQVYEFATALSTMSAGNFAVGLFRAGWSSDASLLADIFKTGGVVNYAKLSDPRIDQLTDLATTESNSAKRLEYFTEIFSRINENASYLMLYDSDMLVAYNKDLYVPVVPNAAFKLNDLHWIH
jgi:ABC-type transport system substrate-binding protein